VKTREEAPRSIANTAVDLCVIGGGASGAGCALDAQLRGISTPRHPMLRPNTSPRAPFTFPEEKGMVWPR